MSEGLNVGTLSMRFDLDTSAVRRGMSDVDRSMQGTAGRAEQSAHRTSEAWSGVGKALGGLAIAKFAVDSVKAYGEAEQSAVRLQDAFARFPKLADSSAESISKISTALATKSRFDDDAINSGAAILAQFGLTGKTVEASLPALVDYAAKTGKDIPAAAAALQKAALGSTKPLKELGITGFKATGDRAKDMATVLGLVGQKTSGFAEKDVHTVQGSLEQLKNRFGEVQEAVGGALVPILTTVTPIIGKMADAAQKAATWFGGLPGPIQHAALAIAGIMALAKVGLFTKLSKGFDGFKTQIATLRTASTAAGTAGAGMSRFGAAARVAGGGVAALGRGMLAAFGGPIGLALIGITAAIGIFQAKNEQSKAAVEAHNAAVEKFSQTLNATTGSLTAASLADLREQLKGSDAAFRAAGSSVGLMAAAVQKGGPAFDAAQQQLLNFNRAAVDNVNKADKSGAQIEQLARSFGKAGVSIDALHKAALAGGDAQVAMANKIGAAGGNVDDANKAMNNYRGAIEGVTPGLKDLDNAHSTALAGTKALSEAFVQTASAALALAKVPAPDNIAKQLQAAANSGKSAETVLKGLGVSAGAASSVIAALGDTLTPAADGAHYFSDEAAKVADTTSNAAEGTEKLATKAKGVAPPIDAMKKALDGMSSAASDADTATQFLQATLDRMAGRNQGAIDALRLEQAALRGIGKASREEAAAKSDVIDKQNALSDARKKATGKDYDAAEKTRDIQKAERELADAQDTVIDKTVGVTKAQEDAARAIEQQVSAVAQTAVRYHGLAAGADAGAAKMKILRKAFIDAQPEADRASGKAAKVADSLGLIPKITKAAILADNKTKDGTDKAKKNLKGVEDRLARVTASDLTKPAVSTAKRNLKSVEDRLARVTAADFTASGVRSAKGTLGGVPDKNAKVTATDATAGGVGSAKASVGSVPSKAVSITARNETGPGIASANASLNLVEDRISRIRIPAAGKALGGAISGGIAGKDSVPILAMPGEHMLTTSDVAKLGGQGGAYRFRQQLQAGKVAKYAGGGAVPLGATLGGQGPFQPGDREGNVRGALGDLASAVSDFAAAAADARSAAGEAKGKLNDANASKRATATEQTGKVNDVKRADAERLKSAENALDAARKRGAKTAAQQASKRDAVAKAEDKLAAVRAQNKRILDAATAAQTKANNAQNGSVKAAERVYTASKRAADTATARARVEDFVQRREAGMRNTLVVLGRQYDNNATKVGNLRDKLAELQSKAADVTSSISGNVQGIGGGILGSPDFTGNSTNAKDMITSLKQNLATAKGFDANIAKLVALGLNPAQAEKVANEDPTGRGGVVAASLAHATKAQIATINSLLAQQTATGNLTGGRVAGAEYGAQIHTTSVQIAATNLNMRIEAAEAKKIGDTIAAATRAAMTGQRVIVTIGAKELNGVIASVVRTEHSAEVRHAAGR